MTSRFRISIAAVAALSLVAAACGNDDDSSTPATTVAPATTAAPGTTAAPDTGAPAPVSSLDFNGDGVVRFGVAIPGPRDDGAYYQALVDKVTSFSEENGFEAPLIVDNIAPEQAATELANIAEQGVDVIAVGASEIAEPLGDLTVQYADIFWYCNCGAGYPETPGLAQSGDDSAEISYTAGYATGLLLQAAGKTSTVFIGCCDLNFEKEAYLSYELGLKAVDPSFTMAYVPAGDFNNTSAATEAFNAALAEGVGAVYPYLGGAHEPVVKAANEAGVIVMTAGSSKGCARTDVAYDIQVAFDAGDYLGTLLDEIQAGTFSEGQTRVFRVGVDPEPGATICNPTAEQQAAMDAVYATVASGELAGALGGIKGQAYGGG